MKVINTDIEGLVVLEPVVHSDSRGYFLENWTERDFERLVGPVHFVQENISRSTRGVVRGLHFQRPPFSQAKLVTVVSGRVLDVALDLRRESPTYGKWHAVELTEDNHRQLFVPRGFAHGFSVLSDTATFMYKCDNYYNPQSEGGLRWDDSALGIDWQLGDMTPVLSPKDLDNPVLSEFDSPF